MSSALISHGYAALSSPVLNCDSKSSLLHLYARPKPLMNFKMDKLRAYKQQEYGMSDKNWPMYDKIW